MAEGSRRPIVLIQDQLRGGGTERQTLELARRWIEAGQCVHLLTFAPGGVLASEADQIAGLGRTCLQEKGPGWPPVYAPRLVPRLRDLDPAVLVCLGRSANLYVTQLRKEFPDTHLVATVRTGKFILPWQRTGWDVADATIVNCNWLRQRSLQLGAPAEKVMTIRNGVALAGVVASPSPLEASGIADAEESMRLLCVAGFRPGKRQARLVTWLALLLRERPELRLTLAGEGSERQKVARLAKRVGLGDQVEFPGHVPDPSVLYRTATIAVSASVEDALPNFLIEAQASGLPVVAVDTGGVRETLQPGISGYVVDPEDGPKFVDCVRLLLDQPSLRREAGQAGASFARASFDPETQARAWLERFEALKSG